MAISLKHNFTSAVADEGDTSLVRPSNWNAEHDLTLATSRLVGRTTAGTGSAEEISVGTGLNLSSGSLTVSSTTPQVNSINTFTVAQVIETTDNSNPALRITQLGTADALLVEDSANPDATPFAITANGHAIAGATSALTIASVVPQFQAHTTTLAEGGFGGVDWGNTATGEVSWFAKSRGGSFNTQAAVQSGDGISDFRFYGSDGTQFIHAARMEVLVDGTPGTNDMPGRFVFSTTPDGATVPTEKMRIANDGTVTITGTGVINASSANDGLRITQTGTGNALVVEDSANPDVTPFAVAANGNVAIGTNSPTHMLSVGEDNSGNPGNISLGRGGLETASIFFTRNGINDAEITYDDSETLRIYNNFSGTPLLLGTNGSERVRISSDGTTTITGTGVVASNSSSTAFRVTQTGSGNAFVVEDSSNPDSSPFVVTAEGRVGIGEDVPLFYLQVAAPNASTQTNVGVTSTNYTSDFKATYLQFSDASTTGTTYGITNANLGSLLFQNTSNALIGTNGGTPLIFGTLSLERMRIASGGNVGIGVTSPTAKLTIANDRAVNTYSLAINHNNGGSFENSFVTGFNGTSQFLGNFQNFPLGIITNNVERIRIGESGQLGIAGANYGTSGQAIVSNGAASAPSWTSVALTGSANTFSANQIISVTDNSNAALRVTQLGTGNAILVEDSTNPDTTPFLVDANGNVISGSTAQYQVFGTTAKRVQSNGTSGDVGFSSAYFNNSANGVTWPIMKSRGATIGDYTIVANQDTLGQLMWAGSDGANFIQAASILSAVDGTPGTNDMPGRLVFSTTADGASSPTERMRIASSGNVGIGTISPVTKLDVSGSGNQTIRSITTDTSGSVFGIVSAQYTGGGGGTASRLDIRAGDGNTQLIATTNTPLLLSTNSLERFRIGESGQFGIGGANYGTSGQILTSGGASAAPSWVDPSSMTLLGTLTTTSGTTQTLTSLTLTGYRYLFLSINDVSATTATDDLRIVDSAGTSYQLFADSGNADNVWNGSAIVNLSNGSTIGWGASNGSTTYSMGTGNFGAGNAGTKTGFGRINMTTASTSIGVSVQTAFDAGTVTVYGVK